MGERDRLSKISTIPCLPICFLTHGQLFFHVRTVTPLKSTRVSRIVGDSDTIRSRSGRFFAVPTGRPGPAPAGLSVKRLIISRPASRPVKGLAGYFRYIQDFEALTAFDVLRFKTQGFPNVKDAGGGFGMTSMKERTKLSGRPFSVESMKGADATNRASRLHRRERTISQSGLFPWLRPSVQRHCGGPTFA
jgi:hypothetical protein